jgi:hypothetical protein
MLIYLGNYVLTHPGCNSRLPAEAPLEAIAAAGAEPGAEPGAAPAPGVPVPLAGIPNNLFPADAGPAMPLVLPEWAYECA